MNINNNLKNNNLIDNFNRTIDYLRISITDRCNLRCQYCMSEPFQKNTLHKDILRYEEILQIVNASVEIGISKVRVTGGEPLVRKDITNFLSQLCEIKPLRDVSLTTNGVLLKRYLDDIKNAGINRLNISLDTLIKEKFKSITGFNYWDDVWEGIQMAREMGFSPIKINVVVMKGFNDNEIIDFGKLSISQPFAIRFIEYMPFGKDKKSSNYFMPGFEIIKKLESIDSLVPVDVKNNKQLHEGPARRFKWENGQGEIGIISPISNHFCHSCNRLRLTANGKLRPCLLSDYEVDLKEALRQNFSTNKIKDLFKTAISKKKLKHNIENYVVHSKMSSIGG